MKGLRWEKAGWKRLVGFVKLKESLVCLGSVRILERAMVVAAMADLMYPLLFAASSNATASADFTFFWYNLSLTAVIGAQTQGGLVLELITRGGTTREDSD